MNADRITQLVAVGVLVVAVIGGSVLTPTIRSQRDDLQLSFAMDVKDEVPPSITLAVTAFGTFRGLFTNVMWYRANQLKEAGEYYEANQLSQWITTIQPRFPQVWAFHAWNMAYNISVATHTPAERWDWVNKGVNLLRDRGIPYNPRAARLYRELGWIFFHKIGGMTDDMHWYYKSQLANDWMELLGSPASATTTQQAIDAFRPVAEAPGSLDELTELYPATAKLIEAFDQIDIPLDEPLLRSIGRINILTASLDIDALTEDRTSALADALDRQVAGVLEQHDQDLAIKPLLAYMRRQSLVNTYNMDPSYMLELMEKFGPVDWRHPAAHALYWSSQGVEKARTVRNDEDIDKLNTDRQVIHSLQMLSWFGRLSYDPVSGRIDLLPDPRFFEAYGKSLDEVRARLTEGQEDGTYLETAGRTFDSGHENFLQRAVVYSYLYGDIQKAQDYLVEARRLYGDKAHNQRYREYENTLESYVLQELRLDIGQSTQARTFIDAMLRRGFRDGLGNNRPQVFDRCLRMAEMVHREYQAESIVNPTAFQDRMKFLPFDQVAYETYATYIASAEVNLLERSRIYRNTPINMPGLPHLRQNAYARFGTQLQQQCNQAQISFNRAFPKPPGLAQYIETQRAVLERQQEAKDTGSVERN